MLTEQLMAVRPHPTQQQKDTHQVQLLGQLQRLFGFLKESQRHAVDTRPLFAALRDLDNDVAPVNVAVQQDVYEYLGKLCSRVEEALVQTPGEKLLKSLIGGTLVQELRSTESEFPYESRRPEEFYAISLEIKGKRTLQEALDLYVKSDALQGENALYCEQHDRKVSVLKRSCLGQLSNTVIFHLKRFEFDMTLFERRKLNSYLEFPGTIDLRPWSYVGLAEAEGRQLPADEVLPHPDSYRYRLVGVLVHSGSIDAGHYYSLVRERPATLGAAPWFEYNDRAVRRFDETRLADECFGGDRVIEQYDSYLRRNVTKTLPRQHNAYMLVYERVHPQPVVEQWQPEDQSAEKSDSVDSASSSASDERLACETAMVAQQRGGEGAVNEFDSVMDRVKVLLTKRSDEERENERRRTLLRSAELKLSESEWLSSQIFRDVLADNQAFLRDQQLLDPSYFQFLLNLLKVCADLKPSTETAAESNTETEVEANTETEVETNIEPEVETSTGPETESVWARAFLLGADFALHTLSRAQDHSLLAAVVDELLRLAERCGAAQWASLLESFVQEDGVRELLFRCPHENVRIQVVRLLTRVLQLLSPVEKDLFECVDSVVVVETKADGVQIERDEHRPRAMVVRFMDYVFGLLEDSRAHWRRFKQYFWLIREWAAMGHRQRRHLLQRHIMELYVDWFMGRSRDGRPRVMVMDENNLPDLVEYLDTMAVVYRGCRTSPPDRPLPPTALLDDEGVLLDMPDDELRELFSTRSGFWSSVLEMDYNSQAAIDVLCHACWEREKETREHAAFITRELSMARESKLHLYAQVMRPLIQMQDSLQRLRIELFLGPYPHNDTRGLLHIVHSQAPRSPKMAYALIKLLLDLVESVPTVSEYMHSQLSEMRWIETFLKERISLHHRVDPSQQDLAASPLPARDSPSVARAKATDGAVPAAASSSGPSAAAAAATAAGADGQDWRRSSTYLNYRRVQRILSAPPPKQRSARETRLEKRVEQLRTENRKLREVLRFYLQHAPDVLPPDLSFLDEAAHDGSDSDSDSDSELETNRNVASAGISGATQLGRSPLHRSTEFDESYVDSDFDEDDEDEDVQRRMNEMNAQFDNINLSDDLYPL